jgi:L-fuculose-phosphate aldolase
MHNQRSLRDAVAAVAVRLHTRGWVANHDGNVTARLGAGRFLATPTGTSKAAVTATGLLVVDEDGKLLSGGGKPFSELGLHLTIYKNRPDVAAVVHAHPPAATGLACAGSPLLERPFIAEAVVSLGPSIPTVPFAAPGAPACAALAPFALAHDAVLVANHGVLAWGEGAEQAYLRLELVEHLAQIALHAERAGGVQPLPDAALAPLLEARRKAFPSLPTPGPRAVVACAPSPTADVTILGKPTEDLAKIIRDEVIRSLRNS